MCLRRSGLPVLSRGYAPAGLALIYRAVLIVFSGYPVYF
jgi:hypothetical protein